MPSLQVDERQASPEVLSRGAQRVGVPRLADKLLATDKVRDLYRRLQRSHGGFALENLLAAMRIELRVGSADLSRIPSTGPVVVVANHPFGLLDGAILTVLLRRVRPDVKVITNFLLADLAELRHHCIFVDPFQSDGSAGANRRGLRDALAWLHGGGMLAMFPAGEVSHWQFPDAQVTDPLWNDTAVRLARKTAASVSPIYFCGHNSVGFHLLGMIHPRLRTAFLLQEFLRQEGRTVEVRVGSEVPADSLAAMPDNREAIEYLRWRSYLLSQRNRVETSWPAAVRSAISTRVQQRVARALPPDVLAGEIAALSPDQRLAENGNLAVHMVKAEHGPNILQELGRLRELTFREVGEGTGKARDLDRFDQYYWHLVLWNKAKREVVGAYRAGDTATILAERGIPGLYTSTLFRYDRRLFHRLGPALELGRSFVRPEYQRQYAPLLLLWKGIARWVTTHPETPVLFGAVSISNSYTPASREIIYRFFESRMKDDELAGMIEPRRPFRPGFVRRWDCRAMLHAFRDLEQLSQPITDLEADGKGLPILLRQYARLGGKLIGFNVDRKFSNTLDGLVAVDLRQADPAGLERFMGREGLVRFRQFHEPRIVPAQ